MGRAAGAGEEPVDAAGLLLGQRHRRGDLILDGDVGHDGAHRRAGRAVAADPRGGVDQRLLGAPADGDVRAVRGQPLGRAPPDAAAPAGDQNGMAGDAGPRRLRHQSGGVAEGRRRGELDRHRLEARDEVGRPARQRVALDRQVEVGQAGQEAFEHDLELQAGQLVAQAEVGAEAEGHVRVGAAGDVEGVGLVEDGLVAVGRGVEEEQLLALADGGVAQLDVAGGRAGHVLDGRHPAQHLLDRTGQQAFGVGGQAGQLLGPGQQLLHAAADDVARRLVAADEDEQGLVDERGVVERVAADLGLAQDADEVGRAARRLAVGQHGVDVRRVALEGVHGPDHGVGVGRALGLEHDVGPLEQLGPVAPGRRRACRRSPRWAGAPRCRPRSRTGRARTPGRGWRRRRRGSGPPWPAPAWA